MNCKLFLEATGMDKTLTRKYQPAVFGLPHQNLVFSGWTLGIFANAGANAVLTAQRGADSAGAPLPLLPLQLEAPSPSVVRLC